jgi:hypothetical protein
MLSKRYRGLSLSGLVACLCLALFVSVGQTGGDKKKPDKKPAAKVVWTDAGDPTIPVDFKFQGEYERQSSHPRARPTLPAG